MDKALQQYKVGLVLKMDATLQFGHGLITLQKEPWGRGPTELRVCSLFVLSFDVSCAELLWASASGLLWTKNP